MTKKIIITLIFGVGFYYGAQFYEAYRMKELLPQCYNPIEVARVDRANASKEEKLEVAREFWSCIVAKQTLIDKFLYKLAFNKIPDSWQSQPLSN